MPKAYSAKKILKTLHKAGFIKISQKGSHIKLRGIRDKKIVTVIVPNHKIVAIGTLKSILKQAEMTNQEFENIL